MTKGSEDGRLAVDASCDEAAMPAVSVIIPHYNDLERLGLCLTALAVQAFNEPYEIIVVDNGSSLPWTEIVDRVGSQGKLILCSEKGAGPARNAGLAEARASVLAFIDSDCRPDPNWLSGGVKALKDYDFVGGRIDVLVQDADALTSVEAFEKVFAFRNEKYIIRDQFTVTANLFAKRAIFDAVGGFKPAVSEDIEWSHRALAGGFHLGYAPEALVGHPARRSWAELTGKWRRTTREGFELARTRKGGRFRFMVRNWAVMLSVVPHALEIARSPVLSSWQQRLGAMMVLVAIRSYRFALAQRLALSSWKG